MKPPLFIAGGAFGASVIDRISESCPSDRAHIVADRESLRDLIEGRPFVGVALWRSHEAICYEIDEYCFRQQVPWFLSLLDGPALCSMLFVPGRGACYACFRRRFLTHQPNPEVQLALERAYTQDASSGPEGYPPPAVSIAVDVLWKAFGSAAYQGSTFSRLHLLTLDASSSEIISVHGCSRCGSANPEVCGSSRFTARAVAALAMILKIDV